MKYEEFEPLFGDWAPKFREFIEGQEMYDIYQKIKKDALKEYIVPTSDNVFKVFQKTNPNNIKNIWYLMDPYSKSYKNKEYQATGIALDCFNSPDDKLQPSLDIFYDGIDKNLNIKCKREKDLQYLLNQGVMLLNTDLTCKLNKTGSHAGLWEPFHKFFLEKVMYGTVGIPYVLSGNESKRLKKYINPLGNYIFEIEHPAAASRKQVDWNHKNIFSSINNLLTNKIIWDYQEYIDCPF
jgi:uracil DNA glycosylase